jgi:hypothetical protein
LTLQRSKLRVSTGILLARTLIGSKMRERRKALGITQVALAARLGISASYLNLIEGNRRNIGGLLLKRVADALELPIDQFDGAAQRRLVDDLGAIAADALLEPLALEPASAAGLASQHAGWARALVHVHRAYRDRSEAVSALTDRLNQDPVLGEAVHNMLTHVAAIRSASEILESDAGLDERQRQRFVSIIADDSRRLSDVSQALAGLFTKAQTATRPILPGEAIDDFLVERENHFPRLEEAAAGLRTTVGLGRGADEPALAEHLERVHRLTVRTLPAPDRMAPRGIELHELMPGPTRRFELARRVAELGAAAEIGTEIAAAPLLASPSAQRQAARALAAYVAGAMLMPYAAFHDMAVAVRYDIDRLARKFNASFEQVCHRLVTLRRPGAEGLRFGFMRSDPAGHVRKRYALPRLPLPRYGTACPLWAIYAAFRSPGTIVRQIAEFPGGDRYLLFARAIEKVPAPFGTPRHFMSVMLMCDALQADRLTYGDGLDLSAGAPATPVGSACRVCVRQGCDFRQEAPIAGVVELQRGS